MFVVSLTFSCKNEVSLLAKAGFKFMVHLHLFPWYRDHRLEPHFLFEILESIKIFIQIVLINFA